MSTNLGKRATRAGVMELPAWNAPRTARNVEEARKTATRQPFAPQSEELSVRLLTAASLEDC